MLEVEVGGLEVSETPRQEIGFLYSLKVNSSLVIIDMNLKSLWSDHNKVWLELLPECVFGVKVVVWPVPHNLTVHFRVVGEWTDGPVFVIKDVAIVVPHNYVESTHDVGVVDVSLFELVLSVSVPNAHILGKGTSPDSSVDFVCHIVKLFLENQIWLLWRSETIDCAVVFCRAQNRHVMCWVGPEVFVVRQLLPENL